MSERERAFRSLSHSSLALFLFLFFGLVCLCGAGKVSGGGGGGKGGGRERGGKGGLGGKGTKKGVPFCFRFWVLKRERIDARLFSPPFYLYQIPHDGTGERYLEDLGEREGGSVIVITNKE